MNEEDRNWPEDRDHENGNYKCQCVTCHESFIGHKRRVICRICHIKARSKYKWIDVGFLQSQQVIVCYFCEEPLKLLKTATVDGVLQFVCESCALTRTTNATN